MNILVIEDNSITADAETAFLRLAGHEAEFVGDGLSALTRLDAPSLPLPDAIVLDICLPGLDGKDFLDRVAIHPKWRHIPVVVTTALTPDIAEQVLADRPVKLLCKPFDPSVLVEILESVGKESKP